MNNSFKKLLPVLFLFAGFNTSAQTNGRDFTKIDAYVKNLGSLDNMSMGTINNVVCNKFTNKIDKYTLWLDWKAEKLILTGETPSNESVPAESLDELTKLIKEKGQTIVTPLPVTKLKELSDDEDEEDEENLEEVTTSEFEEIDDFALELKHNAYIDDIPVYVDTRPNIKVYPVHKPIIKKIEPIEEEVKMVSPMEDEWNF